MQAAKEVVKEFIPHGVRSSTTAGSGSATGAGGGKSTDNAATTAVTSGGGVGGGGSGAGRATSTGRDGGYTTTTTTTSTNPQGSGSTSGGAIGTNTVRNGGGGPSSTTSAGGRSSGGILDSAARAAGISTTSTSDRDRPLSGDRSTSTGLREGERVVYNDRGERIVITGGSGTSGVERITTGLRDATIIDDPSTARTTTTILPTTVIDRGERIVSSSSSTGVGGVAGSSVVGGDASRTTVFEESRNDRHSDTEVREIVKPAITKERIIEENRERVVTAVDKEIHQDHYQTRIQPIVDKQVLPEEHLHRAIPVAVKEHKHGKEREIERVLEAERAQFKSTREVLPTQRIQEGTETVVGEHHHHHVYETIQPVIEREVIRPVVTHTTVPIHERIEREPTFHPKTVQPVMTMEQFIAAGGSVEGRAERRDIFEGEPQVMENGGADVPKTGAGKYRTTETAYTTGATGTNAYGSAVSGAGGAHRIVDDGSSTSRIVGGGGATRMSAAERERIMGRNSPLSSPDIASAQRTSAF